MKNKIWLLLVCSIFLATATYAAAPVINSVNISTTYNLNETNGNLTAIWSGSGNTRNITDWRILNVSIAKLNFQFEGGSNTTRTKDYSTNGLTGNVSGAKYYSGIGHNGGGAYQFKAGQYIQGPNVGALDNFTVSVWLKRNGSGYREYFFGSQNVAAGKYIFAYFGDAASVRTNRPEFAYHYDGNNYMYRYTSDIAITDTNWHFYVFQRWKGNNTAIWVDGVNRSLATQISKGTGGGAINTGSHYMYGISYGDTEALTGRMDDFMIFNKVLSRDQILYLNASRNDLISFKETAIGSNWSVCITPNNNTADGSLKCSNVIKIAAAANASSIYPRISNVIWSTTTGLRTTNLYYNQVLSYVNATIANQTSTRLSLIKPDGTYVLTKVLMTNVTNKFTYPVNTVLDRTGVWKVNITSNRTGLLRSYLGNITVGLFSNPTVADGFNGFDTNTIPSQANILNLSEYDFNLIGMTMNYTNFNTKLASLKLALNQTYDVDTKAYITLYFNKGNYTSYSAECSKITTNFTVFKNFPYYDTIKFFVIKTNSSAVGNRSRFVNEVSACIMDAVDNYVPVYHTSSTKLVGMNPDYVSNFTMPYISESTLEKSTQRENVLLRTTTSMTRIYNGTTQSFKSWASHYYSNVIDNLRSIPKTSSLPTDTRLAKLVNGDLVVFNNKTSSSQTINLSLVASGNDIWDYINKHLIINITAPTHNAVAISTANNSATLLFVDNFTRMILTGNTSSLYKETIGSRTVSNLVPSGGADASISIVQDTDARSEIWSPDFGINNQMFHTYEQIMYTQVVNFSQYDKIVVSTASVNTPSVMNTSLMVTKYPGILNKTYGYMSVADYNNLNSTGQNETNCSKVNAWETTATNEARDIMKNWSMNVFIDGFDIGYTASPACFEQRIKRIGDYIRLEKNKKSIFNTYTIYESVSNYGDAVMRESCFSRWAGNVSSPVYSYENVSLMIENANFMKNSNKPVICMAFGNESDFDKMQWDYFAFAVMYGTKTNSGANNSFRYAQPNFQLQKEIRTQDFGAMLENDYDDSSSSDWSRRYSNGIVHVSPYRNHTYSNGKYYWFDDGKTVNSLILTTKFQNYAASCASGADVKLSVLTSNDGSISTLNKYVNGCNDVGPGQWTANWVNKDITSAWSPNGHYFIKFSTNNSANPTGLNAWQRTKTQSGVHSWYDTTSGNDPASWTAYGRTGTVGDFNTTNMYTNLTINKSTSVSIDYFSGITTTLTKINNVTLTIYNVSLSSTHGYNISILSDSINIPNKKIKSVKTAGSTLSVVDGSTCNTTNPTLSSNQISGKNHGVCRYNTTNSVKYKFFTPKLSSQSYQILVDDKAPIISIISPRQYYPSTSVIINVSVLDAGVDDIWYNNGTGNVPYTSAKTITLPTGNYSYIFYANDTFNNVTSLRYNFSVDTTAPTISILSPRWHLINDTNQTLINFTATDSSGINTTWYDVNGTNETFVFPTTVTKLYRNYTFKFYARDSAGNVKQENYYINFNDYPRITSWSPVSLVNRSGTITFSATVSDDDDPLFMNFTNNGVKETDVVKVDNGTLTYNFAAGSGSNRIIFTVRDAYGGLATKQWNVTINASTGTSSGGGGGGGGAPTQPTQVTTETKTLPGDTTVSEVKTDTGVASQMQSIFATDAFPLNVFGKQFMIAKSTILILVLITVWMLATVKMKEIDDENKKKNRRQIDEEMGGYYE